MSYITFKHYTCNLNKIPFTVKCKYRLSNDNRSDATLIGFECSIGKDKFKGMICPKIQPNSTCPFADTIPKSLSYPYVG
jgi:hypothetical protein